MIIKKNSYIFLYYFNKKLVGGNGRVGRMMLNQQLINAGLLPIIIEPKGKYRQAFRQFQKNKDLSLMTYIVCKGEVDAIEKMQLLMKKQVKQTKEWTPKI